MKNRKSIGCMALAAALLFGGGCTSFPPVSSVDSRPTSRSQRAEPPPASRAYLPPVRAKTPTLRASGHTVTPAPAAKPRAAPAPASTTAGVSKTSAYRLKALDPIIITLRGIPTPQELEDVLDENGAISLPYLGRVQAAGKTSSQLEQEIQRLYLEKQIYKTIAVNIVLPSQSYYVRGEVRSPGRFPLISGVTLLQAIAAAGGYTEFASSKKTTIIRGGKTTYYNVRSIEQSPDKDVDVESGDVIVVPRSIF